MEYRRLGRTAFELSRIGFGAFKIGRNQGIKYAQGYALPDQRDVERLLHGVLDLGINYIDTAPAYGVSEERIGEAIAHRKDEFIISTKVGETFIDGKSIFDFGRRALRESIARSRQGLRIDALDLVFIHSDGNDLRIINETDAVATLMDEKADGAIKAIGFSGKTVEGALAAVHGGWADAIMIEYNPSNQSHEHVLQVAMQRGIGVVVKKPLASGTLNPTHAIPFALRNRAVTSIVIGGLNLDHIRDNVRAAETI